MHIPSYLASQKTRCPTCEESVIAPTQALPSAQVVDLWETDLPERALLLPSGQRPCPECRLLALLKGIRNGRGLDHAAATTAAR